MKKTLESLPDLHFKVDRLLKKLDDPKARRDPDRMKRWSGSVQRVIDAEWESLHPNDFLTLLARRDIPEFLKAWINDSFEYFYVEYLRTHHPATVSAEKVARAIKVKTEWIEDSRKLGKMRIDVRSRKALRNIGQTLEEMQANRDRLSEILSYLDNAFAPLLDAHDEAVFQITHL